MADFSTDFRFDYLAVAFKNWAILLVFGRISYSVAGLSDGKFPESIKTCNNTDISTDIHDFHKLGWVLVLVLGGRLNSARRWTWLSLIINIVLFPHKQSEAVGFFFLYTLIIRLPESSPSK